MLLLIMFTVLLLVLTIGLGLGRGHWEWRLPAAWRKYIVRKLDGIRKQTVSLEISFPSGDPGQIEHSLQTLKINLAGLEKELGVRFHVLIELPENLDQPQIAVPALEHRFPGFVFCL